MLNPNEFKRQHKQEFQYTEDEILRHIASPKNRRDEISRKSRGALLRIADTISQQAARIEELQNPWISVEDRLPEGPVRVLWYTKDIDPTSEYRLATGDMRNAMNTATHWMPLPSPPTEKK